MSLKNLSAKIKIPKIFKDKLKNKRINLIYKRFEKSFIKQAKDFEEFLGVISSRARFSS